MSAPEISIDLSPDPRDRSALLKLLADANVARAGPSHYREFAFLIRDAHTASVEGGLWGSTIYGWFFVEFLFVPPAQRGQGLGSRLLRMAEDAARERGCAGLCLSSYAFQAPGFYEKNGYELTATLPGRHPAPGQQAADTTLKFYRKSLEPA